MVVFDPHFGGSGYPVPQGVFYTPAHCMQFPGWLAHDRTGILSACGITNAEGYTVSVFLPILQCLKAWRTSWSHPITVVGGGHFDMPDTLPGGHGKTIRGLDRDERRGKTSGVPWHPSECK